MPIKGTRIVTILDNTLDKTDPTQKAIGLLATLVEDRMSSMYEIIERLEIRINTQDINIDKVRHNESCPLKHDVEIKKMNDILQPLFFVDKYPKLALLMVIGILSLCGIERLIDLLK